MAVCPDNWSQYGTDKCVLALNVSGMVSEADARCGQLNARTVTVKTEQEQEELNRYLKQLSTNTNSTGVWLGGHRQNLQFAWRNDNELIDDVSYSNWAEGYPTNDFPKACMQLRSDKWTNELCFDRALIVCEKLNSTEDHSNDDKDNNNNNNDNNDNQNEDDNKEDCKNDCKCEKQLALYLKRKLNQLEHMQHRNYNLTKELLKQVANLSKNFNDNQNKVNNNDNENVNDDEDKKKNDNENNSDNNNNDDDQSNDKNTNNDQLNSVMKEVLKEIEHNFTGISGVLNYFNQKLNDLTKEVNDVNHNSPSLEDVREKLAETVNDYVEKKLKNKNLDDLVSDVKLSYVNYRRALMVKKDGSWKTVGFV